MEKKYWRIFAPRLKDQTSCENSSVGRAQPCQGWGREFESRFSLIEHTKAPETGLFFFRCFNGFSGCFWNQSPQLYCITNWLIWFSVCRIHIYAKQKGPLIERPFLFCIKIYYLRRLVFLSIPELGKLLYFFLPLPTGDPMRIIAQRNPMLDWLCFSSKKRRVPGEAQ